MRNALKYPVALICKHDQHLKRLRCSTLPANNKKEDNHQMALNKNSFLLEAIFIYINMMEINTQSFEPS